MSIVFQLRRSLVVATCVSAVAVAACGDDYRDFDASVLRDAGVLDQGVSTEGGIPVGARFTIVGCDALTFDDAARPLCTTSRDRLLTFIPFGTGAQNVVWTFPSGSPSSSTLSSPEVRWSKLGSYTVSLAVGGGGGTALGEGAVKVVAVNAGAACVSDDDCDQSTGLRCLCPAGSGCPGALAAGVCARRCEGTPCSAGEICADLTLGGTAGVADGGANADGGASDAYRVRLCLPSCVSSGECRAGFTCAERPVGSSATGYTWQSACFASVLGPIGAACRDVDGAPDNARCITGLCEPLGARGVCSEDCDDDHPCPSHAVCANVPSQGQRCLARCATSAACDDARMACLAPGPGGLGFTLPTGVPPTTTLCSPKRCVVGADCGSAGTCQAVSGASFCLP